MLSNKYFVLLWAAFSIVYCAPSSSSIEPPIVRTKSGELIGTHATTLLDQRKFLSFRGIPYAQPPIGSLRFRVSYIIIWMPLLFSFIFTSNHIRRNGKSVKKQEVIST